MRLKILIAIYVLIGLVGCMIDEIDPLDYEFTNTLNGEKITFAQVKIGVNNGVSYNFIAGDQQVIIQIYQRQDIWKKDYPEHNTLVMENGFVYKEYELLINGELHTPEIVVDGLLDYKWGI